MWNYFGLHIDHYENTDIWCLIWESTNDNHLYRGQLIEFDKAMLCWPLAMFEFANSGWVPVSELDVLYWYRIVLYLLSAGNICLTQLFFPWHHTHLTLCRDFAHCPSWVNKGLKLSHLSFFPFWWFFSPLTFCIIVPIAVVCLIYLIVFGLPLPLLCFSHLWTLSTQLVKEQKAQKEMFPCCLFLSLAL